MEYRRFNNTIVIRLAVGDEVISSIEEVCREEDVNLGYISGIGATDHTKLGIFSPKEKKYYEEELKGDFEIVSLIGNATRKDGEVYLHLHAVLGDPRNKTYGGHLASAIISVTGEIFIQVVDGEVGRKMSEEIGINLLEF